MTHTDSSVPIACSLTAATAHDREREWSDLLARALISRDSIVGGVRVELRALPGVCCELDRLVAAEMECCPFLMMSVEPAAGSVSLTVTAPAPATPIVERLFAGGPG